MSLENEDQNLVDQPTNDEMQKNSRKIKFSYTREFLLSLRELGICKELPSGFNRSLLSEFDDALVDRHRSTGALSTHSFSRRNEYSSSPPTRGDTNSFLRGTHGKWDARSSGRSDKDSDSQSERESDSGKQFSNQSRRSWHGPEHDGLLGSGSFPRPTGYSPGMSSPNLRANSNYQPNRVNEPYQRPGPYKAPHSRRDTHDNYNDETFGSSAECANEDRVEEERKRRASFELMRKEQQKAFQEKQKLKPDKNIDAFDVSSLLDDNEKRPVKRSQESAEPPVILSALSDDSEKSSVAHIPSKSRPLVPPGFASTLSERNLGVKTSTNNRATEVGVGQPEPVVTRGSRIFSENNEGKLSTKHADDDQLHHRITSLNVPIKTEKDNALNTSSVVDIQDINIGNGGDQLRKRSTISETLKTSDTSEFVRLNAEVKGTEAVGGFSQDDSHAILNKLFDNALSLNSGNSTGVVEPDDKADDTWSPHAFQSSKFAHWFVEEEKKPLDDFTHRPNELLSLIVGGEKSGLQVSDPEKTWHVAPASPFQNAEPAYEHLTSNAHNTIDNSEQFYKSDKPDLVSAVLTCEDLEQSILSQVNESGLSIQQPKQDKDSHAKTEQSNSSGDNHASQHLLSLLQKGTCQKDMEQSSILDVDFADKVCNADGATANIHGDPGEANAGLSNSSKQLTLETLFGTAFMKELQSVGAPLSVQRGSVESAGLDVSDPILSLFPASDNSLPLAGGNALNRHGSGILPSEKGPQPKPNRFGEQWLDYGDPQGDVNPLQFQSKFAKASGFDRPNDILLPEEDSLIAVSDPLQNFLSAGSSAKADLAQDIPVDISGKLAALNQAYRIEQPIMGNQEGSAYSRAPYDMREPGNPYPNLNVQRSSRLQPLQLNHMGPMFNQLDSHPPHISPYMKLMTPEGMVHRESPPNHQFSGNTHLPPFDQPSNAVTGFDPPAHHSMLQQLHMQGNLPPPHLFRGFPGGVPPPAHPNNPMTGFIQEPNPMQGFPFSGHRQSPFGGPGLPHQASDVAGGRNHPETLQRLFEMELRSRARPGF